MKIYFSSIFLLFLLVLQPGYATAADKGYEEFAPIQRVEAGSPVEVVEYFWFGCPHCYAFEPAISSWVKNKPEGTVFVREAPPLNRSWLPQSQAFYAAEILGITDVILEPMFNAIHRDKRSLRKPGQIVNFVGELGVDKEEFEKTMKSFAVDVRINRSLKLARAAGITGVPTVVIDSRYKTSGSIAGTNQRAIELIDALSLEALESRDGT